MIVALSSQSSNLAFLPGVLLKLRIQLRFIIVVITIGFFKGNVGSVRNFCGCGSFDRSWWTGIWGQAPSGPPRGISTKRISPSSHAFDQEWRAVFPAFVVVILCCS
jgi:hypothetical protein